MKCNEILDWAEVIAAVQNATEPSLAGSADGATVPAAGPTATAEGDDASQAVPAVGRREVIAPALSMLASDAVDPDPFAQRLR